MPGSRLFRNIVFPTDFSKSSEAITGNVVGLASACDAKVWLLSVVASMADFHGASECYFGPFNDEALINMEAERKALALDRLQKLRLIQQEYFYPVASEICVKSAGVAESIVEYARETEADLIMMPTRGAGPMRRFLIGSVTAKVLHDASCSVWTSPHPRELEPFHSYRHIVLAVDHRALTVELLVRSSEIAEFFHAQLSVLSALPSGGDSGDDAAQKRKREMADTLKERVAARNVRASVHVLEASPGEAVRQIAEMEEADLIVIGRGHMEEAMGHLWTHAYEIIRDAPCPVITLSMASASGGRNIG